MHDGCPVSGAVQHRPLLAAQLVRLQEKQVGGLDRIDGFETLRLFLDLGHERLVVLLKLLLGLLWVEDFYLRHGYSSSLSRRFSRTLPIGLGLVLGLGNRLIEPLAGRSPQARGIAVRDRRLTV